MSTTIRRWNPAAILRGAALAVLRVSRRLARRARRRPLQPLAGLSDHMLRDIGMAPSPWGRVDWRADRPDSGP